MTSAPEMIDGPNGRLAYRSRDGSGPGVVWLGGFRSDMLGTKAEHLDQWAASKGRAFLRFDYSGHGESDGVFVDGCISDWKDDALRILDTLTHGPQILVGSSMGGWIASLIALARPEKIAAIVFIAPAPDFTERLMWPAFTDAERGTLLRDGRLEQPSDYSDEPEIITKKLIEDGRKNLVMTGNIAITCTVRILQGMKDDAVPYDHAIEFAKQLVAGDVEILMTPQGDHRLSEQPDLERLTRTIEQLPF
ncbi:alpha/beta hydrolase [Hyphococcus flavus]|uniref:Palmitoyl-protein thioesterase ABHD10, mitochondrial n=1 Tax=Hyphococcus flavus TaxID=1866326 RepID=A0AAE9ZJX9_9PROT|nr:alpha/beta hydrolase [Hyphococcus flavus]WDI31980.1 alpha/beta hydrolase [Hyphococcus flavus]